jgi:hypothetical protein
MDATEAVSAIVARREPTAISKPYDVHLSKNLKKTLTALAEARQAGVSAETLNLYSRELCEFDPADVRDLVRALATRKRADGETAFPSLGDLIEPLKAARSRRIRQEREERERQARIDEFWNEILPHRMTAYGWTEQEALDRFPEFRGTGSR